MGFALHFTPYVRYRVSAMSVMSVKPGKFQGKSLKRPRMSGKCQGNQVLFILSRNFDRPIKNFKNYSIIHTI